MATGTKKLATIKQAYVSLGSNQGDSRATLRTALRKINALHGVRIERQSKVYLTEPQGFTDQPFFFNQVIECLCLPEWTALSFFQSLSQLELQLGRQRGVGVRYGPRIIDLDLLSFNGEQVSFPDLLLPHPRMADRAFVLVPLLEINPSFVIPGLGLAADALVQLSYAVKGSVISQREALK